MNEETLSKLFEYNRQLHKELSGLESAVNAHLESSVVRVEGYDKDISSVKADIEILKTKVDVIQKFIENHNGKKQGVEELKSLFLYIIGAIATILGIVSFYLSVRK